MSSHQESTSESSCEDEEDEMVIMAKRDKKLVLQKKVNEWKEETSIKIGSRVIFQETINFYNMVAINPDT